MPLAARGGGLFKYAFLPQIPATFARCVCTRLSFIFWLAIPADRSEASTQILYYAIHAGHIGVVTWRTGWSGDLSR